MQTSFPEPRSAADIPREWDDCTELLQRASGEMEVGQLVTAEDFSLEASMHAVELMHPRMDAGMRKDEHVSLRERLESGELPLQLAPDDLLRSLDALVQAMVRLLATIHWFL